MARLAAVTLAGPAAATSRLAPTQKIVGSCRQRSGREQCTHPPATSPTCKAALPARKSGQEDGEMGRSVRGNFAGCQIAGGGLLIWRTEDMCRRRARRAPITSSQAAWITAQPGWGSNDIFQEEDESQACDTSPARLSQLASRFNRRSSYNVLRINADGSKEKVTVTRRELLQTSGLKPRDLRRVDPCLSTHENSPVILVRKNAWLVSFQQVRAVISKGYVLFFGNSEGTKTALDVLERRLAYKADAVSQFELEVLEATLMAATQELDKQLNAVAPKVTSLMGISPSFACRGGIEKLRIAKQALVEIGSRADSLRQCVLEVLEEDEDVRRMAGTFMRSNGDTGIHTRHRKPHISSRNVLYRHAGENNGSTSLWALAMESGEAAAFTVDERRYGLPGANGVEPHEAEDEFDLSSAEEEVELLLEYYLERAVSIHMEAQKLLAVARDMETSVQVHLSSRRYEVQRLELLLTVGAFAVGIGALVSGIFGMNLTSRLEEHVWAFYLAVGGILAGCGIIFAIIYNYIKERSIF